MLLMPVIKGNDAPRGGGETIPCLSPAAGTTARDSTPDPSRPGLTEVLEKKVFGSEPFVRSFCIFVL